jgi:hypothetical protein
MKLKIIYQYTNKVKFIENIYLFTRHEIKEDWKRGSFKLEFYE